MKTKLAILIGTICYASAIGQVHADLCVDSSYCTGSGSGSTTTGTNSPRPPGSTSGSSSTAITIDPAAIVILARNGPYAANYGTWRSEYIVTKTADGKYANPTIKIYSDAKNSLRCTGKIVLEDEKGFYLPPAVGTKFLQGIGSAPVLTIETLVTASTGFARWAPSFSVQCENIDDYHPTGTNSVSSPPNTDSATSSNGSAGGAGGSNSILGPSFQIGQGLVQPGISIVPSNNPASSSGNSAGSSAPNCLEPDGCYFGFFGKITTDSGPADGLVKKVRFNIEQVSNTSGRPSGDIRVEVWAMLDGKNGYLVGQKNLSSLESGYYRPTSVDADVTLMPSGSYRAVLVVRSAIGSDALQMDGLLNSYGPNGSGNSLKTTLADQAGAVPEAGITNAPGVAADNSANSGSSTQTGSTNQATGTPPASHAATQTNAAAAGDGGGGGGGGCSVGSGNPLDPSLWLLAIGAAAALVSRKRSVGR